MLKKVISVMFALCLIFGIGVMAMNSTEGENIPAESSQRPMRGNFHPSRMPQGEFDPSRMPQGEFTPPATNENGEITENAPQQTEGQPQFGGGFRGGMGGFPGNMQNGMQNTQPEQEKGFKGFVKTYSTPITSVVLLALAYIFVLSYKRKHY